jgi:exosortase A-associated hydrolase 1
MRFDYRGMGDSEGESVRFDATAPDIAAAVRIFREHLPEIETVVLWGLCDGAAACALAEPDPSIGGMVLVNPWVRTDEGAAKATLRHYYIRQVLAPVFWRKLARGGIELRRAVGGLFETLRRATRPSVHRAPAGARPLPERVASGILRHATPTLVMLSGNDQTAAEFRLVAHRSGALRSALNAVALTEVEIPDADHTLSAARWRDRATQLTVDWLYANFPARFAVDR